MTIALIGYGRMGKEIEQLAARRRDLRIGAIFDIESTPHGAALTSASLEGVDVCIDFSAPAAVLGNIAAVAAAGKNIVVGTTGWYEKLDEVKAIVQERNIGLLYASNFSIGMNLFFEIVASAAQLIDKVEDYDVALSETHHTGKLDSPSGTALALGAILLEKIGRKKELFAETAHGQVKPEQLHVTSTRVGATVGTHRVVFDAGADTIELVHTAKNRSGFALGALVAAEWLAGKKGLYTMKDVVHSL